MPQAPPQELTQMTAPWPFTVWGIDLIGALPTGKGGVKYAVVAIDYFTKWVEAEPLATITTKRMIDFVFRSIVCCFEIPHTLVSDNSTQFDNEEFRAFCTELGIKKVYSSVARPQANGQVESVNKTIKHILKAKLDEAKGAWPKELSKILWAYRTTTKTTTEETPFSLSYGSEAMVPVEVGAGSIRRELFGETTNEELQRLHLDLLEERRESAELRAATYRQRVARFFNSRVRHRDFEEGDLVLKKVFGSLGNQLAGALGPNWEGPYLIRHKLQPGTYQLSHLDGTLLSRSWNVEHLRRYYQ